MPSPPPARPLPFALVLAAGLPLYAALAVTSMRTKSAVYDETAHLPAGYTYLKLRDFRMNPEHPPLAKELAALPLLLMDVQMNDRTWIWTFHREWEFGNRFLYHWNDADRLLFRGRLPIVGLGCVLCAAVALWTRSRWGPAAGAIALFLCVLSPDVLAHGQVVTTDLAVALFLFLSVVGFEAVGGRVTPVRVVLAGLAAGAAFASKFSALVLVPILGALAVVIVGSPAPLVVAPGRTPARPVHGARGKVAVMGLVLAAMSAVALATLWAAYAFEGRLARDAVAEENFAWPSLEPSHPFVGAALHAVRRAGVVPEPYVHGLLVVLRDSASRPSFLLGRVSDRGWWWYFPATFAFKTPLALMGLLALPLLAPRGAADGRRSSSAFVWVPVVIYAGLAIASRLNIGHRHLLPVYPFLFAAAGAAASSAWARGRARRWAVAALCAWYAGSVLLVHPHYLAYFNELAGGPSRGWRVLVDSNLDWGQDLAGLKRWTEEHGVTRCKLSYFGTADPSYYALPCQMLPSKMHPDPPVVVREVQAGDVVAVSATNLQGVYLEGPERRLMSRLRGLTPVDRVGYSIFVFRSDFSMSLDAPGE